MLDDIPCVSRALMLDCICIIPEGLLPATQPWEVTSQSLWNGEEGAEEQNTGSASRSPGEGSGNPLQYSCLASVLPGVAKSRT